MVTTILLSLLFVLAVLIYLSLTKIKPMTPPALVLPGCTNPLSHITTQSVTNGYQKI